MNRYLEIIFLLLLNQLGAYAQKPSVTEKQCYDFYNNFDEVKDAFYLTSKVSMWNFCLDTNEVSKGGLFTHEDIGFISDQIKNPVIKQWKQGHIKNATVIADSKLHLIFSSRRDGWSNFYKKYSINGYFSLSPPFFSIKGDRCVVYMSNTCGGLCGSGDIYFCEKKGKRWVVTGRRGCWVS